MHLNKQGKFGAYDMKNKHLLEKSFDACPIALKAFDQDEFGQVFPEEQSTIFLQFFFLNDRPILLYQIILNLS